VDGGGVVRVMKGVRWEAPPGAIRVAGHEVVRRRVKQVGYWERWALITGAGARAEGPEVVASAAVGEESQGAAQRSAAAQTKRESRLAGRTGPEGEGGGGSGGRGGEGEGAGAAAEHLLFWTRRVAWRLPWGTKASEGRR
jgi:hypothetical protein